MREPIPYLIRRRICVRFGETFFLASLCSVVAALFLFLPQHLHARCQQNSWSDQEKPILAQLGGLRALPDDVRARTTKQLAMQIRQLPAGMNKVRLAEGLANLATEGDFGRDTLQEVTTTLAVSLLEHPLPAAEGKPASPYTELAKLVRYEHMQANLDDPQLSAAMAILEAQDVTLQQINFTLTDIAGKPWTLGDLHGKVVLVNFWATWCPPCRKEMPDLESLYEKFGDKGLLILSISDEDANKVVPFVKQMKITYPVLLDPGRKVNEMFQMDSIPKSFVYDRSGKLVAQSIDMRTQRQFLEMLKLAGIQ